jgi:hypothetical protein
MWHVKHFLTLLVAERTTPSMPSDFTILRAAGHSPHAAAKLLLAETQGDPLAREWIGALRVLVIKQLRIRGLVA